MRKQQKRLWIGALGLLAAAWMLPGCQTTREYERVTVRSDEPNRRFIYTGKGMQWGRVVDADTYGPPGDYEVERVEVRRTDDIEFREEDYEYDYEVEVEVED
jgi:hypothetical protein